MKKKPAKSKPKTARTTAALRGVVVHRPCSALTAPLPICLLRMVVQVEDTPTNRTALSAAKAKLLRDTTFDGVQNSVKMEQLAVISLCKPNVPDQRPASTKP